MCPHHRTPTAKNTIVLFNYNISVGLGKAIWGSILISLKIHKHHFYQCIQNKFTETISTPNVTGTFTFYITGKLVKFPPPSKTNHTHTQKAMHEETGRMENTLSFYGLSHSLAGLPKYKPYQTNNHIPSPNPAHVTDLLRSSWRPSSRKLRSS